MLLLTILIIIILESLTFVHPYKHYILFYVINTSRWRMSLTSTITTHNIFIVCCIIIIKIRLFHCEISYYYVRSKDSVYFFFFLIYHIDFWCIWKHFLKLVKWTRSYVTKIIKIIWEFICIVKTFSINKKRCCFNNQKKKSTIWKKYYNIIFKNKIVIK